MSNWIDRAEQEIEDAYADGTLSETEYHSAHRDLINDIRSEAEEAAHAAYDDAMGGW